MSGRLLLLLWQGQDRAQWALRGVIVVIGVAAIVNLLS